MSLRNTEQRSQGKRVRFGEWTPKPTLQETNGLIIRRYRRYYCKSARKHITYTDILQRVLKCDPIMVRDKTAKGPDVTHLVLLGVISEYAPSLFGDMSEDELSRFIRENSKPLSLDATEE